MDPVATSTIPQSLRPVFSPGTVVDHPFAKRAASEGADSNSTQDSGSGSSELWNPIKYRAVAGPTQKVLDEVRCFLHSLPI